MTANYSCYQKLRRRLRHIIDAKWCDDIVNIPADSQALSLYPAPLTTDQLINASLAFIGNFSLDNPGEVPVSNAFFLGRHVGKLAMELSYSRKGRKATGSVERLADYGELILNKAQAETLFAKGVTNTSNRELLFAQEAVEEMNSIIRNTWPNFHIFLKQKGHHRSFVPPKAARHFRKKLGPDSYPIFILRGKIHFWKRMIYESSRLHNPNTTNDVDWMSIYEEAYVAAVANSELLHYWLQVV